MRLVPTIRLSGDDGGILVGAAVALVAFSMLGLVLLDVGQWFQHRRHLQVRADAAALAGAQLFNECFDTAAFTTAQAKTDIENAALKYSGMASGDYNTGWQKGVSSPEAIAFQSNTYPASGSSGDGGLGGECAQLMLDVKMTQSGLPKILSLSPLATAHAWARVELQQVLASRPSFPLAIPNFDTSKVGVTFVDENTGLELQGCTGAVVAGTTCTYAFPGPSTAITAPDGEGLTQWTLPSAGVNLPKPSAGGDLIGVRLSVGSQVGSCAQASGSATYACIELGTTNGVVGIRDYPTPASPTYPQLYQVYPSETCSPDASPFFSEVTGVTSCSATVQARVDFGATPSNVGANLTATFPDGTSIRLTAVNPNAQGGLWQGTGTIPVGDAATQSEYPVTLSWTSTKKINNSKSGTFGVVQRFTSGDDTDDGPVKMVSLSDPSVTSPYSYAYATSGSNVHSIGVTVALANAGITNKLTFLREPKSGSSTSWIQCYVPPGTPNPSPYNPELGNPGIQDGMQYGCSFTYAINQALTCPDAGGAQPIPADCVPNKPSSDEGNAIRTALNARFGCGTSSPFLNNWPNYTKPGDPRAVTMITTTYNAYANGGKSNGSQPYPVTGFADFYITGFSGDNCPTRTSSQPPTPGLDDPPPSNNKNAGYILGYFIQYAKPGDIPSGRKCQLNSQQQCTAALTR